MFLTVSLLTLRESPSHDPIRTNEGSVAEADISGLYGSTATGE